MEINYKKLGSNLARIRKQQKKTQSEIEELAGLSQKYLSNIENAKSIPSLEVLVRLCEALKVTPNEVLLGVTQNETDLDHTLTEKIQVLSKDQKRCHIVINFINFIIDQEV